jgi:1-phosphofructokinase family hexose kinase
MNDFPTIVIANVCQHKSLIVTLTVNPAIDRTITVDRLAFEDRAYILSTKDTPGGRGINASSIIHSFGGETLAVLPAGGSSGKRFEESLKQCGFPVIIVPIRNKVRTNLIITDSHGLTVKLNEHGPKLSSAEVKKIENALHSKMKGAAWLMLCGSLPPGAPSDMYARIIEHARTHKVKTLLDTDGDAFRLGLAANPTVVSPNQEEAERLLNTAPITRTNCLQAVERMHRMGAESVVLSLGNRGAVAAHDGHLFEAVPPRVDALCPIGAGDAQSAAFLWAREQDQSFAEAVRWGVAAGTASAMLPGMKFASLEQTRDIFASVEVREVAE